jgi:hypothetical protein
MYAKLKMELKVLDCVAIDDGFFRVYTQKMVNKNVTPEIKKEVEDFFTLKSEVDLAKFKGKEVSATLGEPFTPRDNSNIYYRIKSAELIKRA